MITIYHADAALFQKKYKLDYLLCELPENMHERALRYQFKPDAYRYVLGRILLKKGLTEMNLNTPLQHLSHQKNGKPFLAGVHFNISHSDKLVVCAFSEEGEIGIDVEREKQIHLPDFAPWFTRAEWADINNGPRPVQQFYRYWTRKESIIKALGTSLADLHKIELDSTRDTFTYQGRKWYLKNLDFGQGFTAALCSEMESSILLKSMVSLEE